MGSMKALLRWAKEPPYYVTHSATTGHLAEFRHRLEADCFTHEGKLTQHGKLMRQAAKAFDALMAKEALTAHTRGGRHRRRASTTTNDA